MYLCHSTMNRKLQAARGVLTEEDAVVLLLLIHACMYTYMKMYLYTYICINILICVHIFTYVSKIHRKLQAARGELTEEEAAMLPLPSQVQILQSHKHSHFTSKNGCGAEFLPFGGRNYKYRFSKVMKFSIYYKTSLSNLLLRISLRWAHPPSLPSCTTGVWFCPVSPFLFSFLFSCFFWRMYTHTFVFMMRTPMIPRCPLLIFPSFFPPSFLSCLFFSCFPVFPFEYTHICCACIVEREINFSWPN